MRQFCSVFIAVLWGVFVLSLPAASLPEHVTVRLFEVERAVPKLLLAGKAKLVRPAFGTVASRPGQYYFVREGAQVALYAKKANKSSLVIRSARMLLEEQGEQGVNLAIPEKHFFSYRGSILIKPGESQDLAVLNIVSARDFVYSVVGSELPKNFKVEAKKALAVLTLSRLEFLPANKAIGDSTKSELYRGSTMVGDSEINAVDSVWKKRLFYKDSIVLPYYHSTCAGSTSSGTEFFQGNGEDLSYLSRVKCSYCKNSPFFRFKKFSVPVSQLKAACNGALPVVQSRDKADRPLVVRLGKSGKATSGYRAWIKLGRGLGWGNIPGTRYYFEMEPDDKCKVSSSGAGHGVGLCQWGANQLAAEGKTYLEILRFYYPNCQIK